MELTTGTSANTIPALLARRAADHGPETILRKKDRGIWKTITWAELAARVRDIGQALKAAGFGQGDVAAVISETRPEFVYADLAILGSGGVSVAIHPEEEADRVGHVLRSAGCRLVFVENEEQLDKVLTIRDTCPALSRIVILDMKGLRDFADPQAIGLQAFIQTGTGSTGWDAGIAAITPDQPAVILFPRGQSATGHTLTHGDIMHLLARSRGMLPLRPGDERLAVLPMCDVTERVLGLYLSLETRTVSNYLEGPETATENLQQIQPTVFGADAEAWERLYDRVTRAANGATPLQRTLYRWAVNAGRIGGSLGALGDTLILRAVRRELGLSRLRLAYVGGTPITPEVERWTRALGITVHQVGKAAPSSDAADARYHALMQEAYAGT